MKHGSGVYAVLTAIFSFSGFAIVLLWFSGPAAERALADKIGFSIVTAMQLASAVFFGLKTIITAIEENKGT